MEETANKGENKIKMINLMRIEHAGHGERMEGKRNA
jgi:hypothetical protein